VSRRIVKSSKRKGFSPLFLRRCSFLINASGRRRRRGKNASVSSDFADHAFAPENSNLIDKKVSRRTGKQSKPNRFSPFFFVSLLLCNERERVAEAAGQTSVFELRYNRLRVGPGNRN
jgi:hypothetical protein